MAQNAQPVEMSVGEKVAAAKQFAAAANPIPEVPEPPADFVKLDGGFLFEGDEQKTAVVRELTGEHEESLSRALKSDNGFHFLQVLLECGVASIGSVDPSQIKKALRSMLIGDRDRLALAIRIATYGDTIEVQDWPCPACGGKTTLELNLTEDDVVPSRKLAKVSDTEFEVELRKGGKAKVRLPNGADQLYVYEDDTLTGAERDSRLLQRCVLSVTDAKGTEHVLVIEPSYVLKMSIPDRRAILNELRDRQPGPKYNEIKFTHEECGNEVSIVLGLVDLFRDLLLFL